MILQKIIREKEKELELLKLDHRSLGAVLSAPGVSIIAEIKRASPSRGIIETSLEPAERLKAYEEGGAGAISVVTDKKFFQGDTGTLRLLRPMTSLPILRKDFLIDPLQLYESLFLGADAVLLIASVLEEDRLEAMLETARSIGLEALVEVHGEEELLRVLDTSAELLGINNRNLEDFSVDLGVTERLMEVLRSRAGRKRPLVVAESGVSSVEDACFLAECGVDGILVGSFLVESPKPQERLGKILEGVAAGGAGQDMRFHQQA